MISPTDTTSHWFTQIASLLRRLSSRYTLLPLDDKEAGPQSPAPANCKNESDNAGRSTDQSTQHAERSITIPLPRARNVLLLLALGAGFVVYQTYPFAAPTHDDAGRDITPRPNWWPDESDMPENWGWTEEMGWKPHGSARGLGEEAEEAYKLGFEVGEEGTAW